MHKSNFAALLTPSTRRLLDGVAVPVPHCEHLTHWLICAQVASRNGKHAFSPRAKNFDCGGCELALLGLTMCPMRSEPPYDFPQGVTAAIFHQTVKFRTIFWARTNVVKMSFASRPASHVTCA